MSKGSSSPVSEYINPLPLPPLYERVEEALHDGTDTLYICPDAWALRHRFVNRETGEMIRARFGFRRCFLCGPRKVELWRQLIKAVEPRHFVTLTKVGWTVEEAARVLTTVIQYLRRGSKGKGPNHMGARDAYPIEYFVVLERHKNFEKVGFHWHMLVKGVEFLPNQVVSDALRSATKGRSWITKVKGVRNNTAVGYVTKYLTKDITREEKGVREERREMIELGLDENGQFVEQRYVQVVEVVSKARRIRYSRHFFPESVTELRARLFADLAGSHEIEIDASASGDAGRQEDEETSAPGDEQQAAPVSSWVLHEHEPFSHDVNEYRRRRRQALREVLNDRQANGRRLSGRVVNVWDYQRRVLADEKLSV